MQGKITLSNGEVLHFDDANYLHVISTLTDSQKYQLAALLRQRLGGIPDNEFGVDEETFHSWHEDVHRKDIIRGGGESTGSKVRDVGGKKYTLKKWQDKTDGEKNVAWLRSQGFKRRWKTTTGYIYSRKVKQTVLNIDPGWLELTHEAFKKEVIQLIRFHEKEETI